MAYMVDNATPILTKLMRRSPGLALDVIDHIAVVANKAIRRQIAAAGRVDWHQRVHKSKRTIYHKTGVRQGYRRYSHTTGEELADMQGFVVNKMYAARMKAIVGSMDVRGFYPDRYRGGQIDGKEDYVKGTKMDKIGKKLEGGGPLTGFFAGRGGRYIGRPVVGRAKREIFGKAQALAQKALEQAVREFKREVGAA